MAYQIQSPGFEDKTLGHSELISFIGISGFTAHLLHSKVT